MIEVRDQGNSRRLLGYLKVERKLIERYQARFRIYIEPVKVAWWRDDFAPNERVVPP